jgi:hypothetical protein
MEQVAESRKMQRILQNKGATFLALLNDTRMDIAKNIFRTRNEPDGRNFFTGSYGTQYLPNITQKIDKKCSTAA